MLFISWHFSVKIPERVINIWLCGFLENNTCLHLDTPAIVTLFLLQTDPDPHRRREKICGPHRNKFGDPWLRSYTRCISSFTEVRLQPRILVVDAEVGVERRRLRTRAAAGDGEGVEQLLQVLPASDTVEETTQHQVLLFQFDTTDTDVPMFWVGSADKTVLQKAAMKTKWMRSWLVTLGQFTQFQIHSVASAFL